MSKFDNSCSNSTKQNQAEVMTDIWPSFMYLQMPPVFKTGTKRGITGVLGEIGQSLCQNIQISNLYDSWRTPFKVCTLAGRYRCKWQVELLENMTAKNSSHCEHCAWFHPALPLAHCLAAGWNQNQSCPQLSDPQLQEHCGYRHS